MKCNHGIGTCYICQTLSRTLTFDQVRGTEVLRYVWRLLARVDRVSPIDDHVSCCYVLWIRDPRNSSEVSEELQSTVTRLRISAECRTIVPGILTLVLGPQD